MSNRFAPRIIFPVSVITIVATVCGFLYFFERLGIEALPAVPGYAVGRVVESVLHPFTYQEPIWLSDHSIHRIATWACGITTFFCLSVLSSPFLLYRLGMMQKWVIPQTILILAVIPIIFVLLVVLAGMNFPMQS